MKYILFLSLPLYALDQITKWLVLRHIPLEGMHVIIPDFFALVHITNDGAAFGSFKNNNLFFIILSCVAFVFVFALLVRRRSLDRLRDISLALLLAGIMGNLTDRFVHGAVIDFVLVDLHVPFANPWPAFNVADSCIFIAVFCFITHSFKNGKKAEPAITDS
ncbi:MAG: signal peptidase II [Verrucomicrobiaceae bacterium]|nr:signal peptidase II [Verrucomicrobiaceae bacterium]